MKVSEQKAIEGGVVVTTTLFGLTLTEIDLYISIAAGLASLIVAGVTAYLLIRKARSNKNDGTKPENS